MLSENMVFVIILIHDATISFLEPFCDGDIVQW